MKKGKLIVVEGSCDGIGKTTQYNLLGKYLENEGEKVIKHHFPSYGTYHGFSVEKYLKGEYGSPHELSAYFVNSLYAHDRAITWQCKLKQEFENGGVILLDRYTTSSIIYQSALIEEVEQKKDFIDYVIDYEYHRIGIKKPDSVLFLDVPFELATKLRRERKENEGITDDIHESNLEFMKKVYDSAMFVADYLLWNKIKCNNGDKMRSIEDIHQDVCRLVKKL